MTKRRAGVLISLMLVFILGASRQFGRATACPLSNGRQGFIPNGEVSSAATSLTGSDMQNLSSVQMPE